ncbi:MAG: ABC transporter permease [Gluconacetobacter sp.]|uniref:ABC transporter permease n=1 Tax=Gluconacetobacter dulcium TaxID=2729096 RepID=A0A7W4JYG4_9PROT|nr:ABC transporter permease [Gluconacetobacter dulcium]MBB2197061.1 ABC transporter permease [Gluconacetobacter dulcium]
MTDTFVSRLARMIVTLAIVSVAGFLLLHLAPGDPLAQFALSPGMTETQLGMIRHQMGLDVPLPLQYLVWVKGLVVGDWGRSFRDHQPVLTIIFGHLGATLELAGTASLLATWAGASMGLYAAFRQGSRVDTMMTIVSVVLLSIPTFWFGLVFISLFSVRLGWLPSGNIHTVGGAFSLGDYLRHLFLPAIVLALGSTAIWSRYTRNAVAEVLGQDYIRTARAKGLSPRRIRYRHVLRNALLPMITLAGLQFPTLLSGALVTETVFTWPGIGRLFLDSLEYRDYPVAMGILMFSAVLATFGSILTDALYAVADPRLRVSRQ